MLGDVASGTMSNDNGFYAELEAAAARSGEKFWRMPGFPEYRKLIETPVADLRNTSDGAVIAVRNKKGTAKSLFSKKAIWLEI